MAASWRLPRGMSIVAAIIAWHVAAPVQAVEPGRPAVRGPNEISTTGKMNVRVVNADGEALPGAAIHVNIGSAEEFDNDKDYLTDQSGSVEIKLPRTLTVLRLSARSDGHVPLVAQLWPPRPADGRPIPPTFTFRLAKGSVIGGIVKNANGQPIAGAKVEVMCIGRTDDFRERPVVDTWLAYGDDSPVTDALGRWTLDNVPADELTELAQVRLTISHPDYISEQARGDMQQTQNVTMEQLRTKTAVIVMRQGINLAGKVTDALGKPVAGAVVIYGNEPLRQPGSQEVRTGEDGTYHFPPLPTGPMTVTVVAEGWMPQLRKIDITPANPPVDFKLTPGKKLRLRFVDSAGKPIPKVFVQIDKWRGGESLYNFKNRYVLDTKIPIAADENGIYEWTWAPDDAVTYDFYRSAKDRSSWTTMSIAADDAERTIRLAAMPDKETAEARRPAVPRPKVVSTTGKMRVRVVNADGKALPGASVEVSVWTAEEFDANKDYFTDLAGTVEIQLPKTLSILRIWARSDGHVPLFAEWWPEHQDNGFPIPEEFIYQLTKGSVVGGIVKNADGQPIAGVRVEVAHAVDGDDPEKRPVVDAWLAFGGAALFTDALGRWTLDNVNPADGTEIELKISHPDYISDQTPGEMQKKQKVTMEQLRAKTAVIVMQRGVSVAGTVTDALGKPIAGAVVIHGDDPYTQRGSQEVRTAVDGTYRFPPLAPGPMTVTVIAEGCMPQLRKIDITPENPPVDFKLSPGKALRLRFVDLTGKPIPEVIVQIDKWRGGQSLYNHKHPNVLDTKIPITSDENGIYEWTWAPDDAVTYDIYRPKITPRRTTVSLTADGAERTIRLPVNPGRSQISGAVTDAETGEPISEFTAIPVLELASGELLVGRSQFKRASGRYSLEIESRDVAYRVRIEAPGYRSALSDASFHYGDADTTCDFSLRRAPTAAGRVLTTDRQPVSGAFVRLATATQPLFLVQQHQQKANVADFGPHADSRATNANGEFAFPAQHERYFVIIFDYHGYGEAFRRSDEAPGDLILSDFARVEGRLMGGGQPIDAAEVTLRPVRLQAPQLPKVSERYTARTDHEGRFVFKRMPPLKCALTWARLVSQDRTGEASESIPLDLQPGQTTTIDLGGAGAEVRGQVALKGEQSPNIDLSCSLNFLLHKAHGIKPSLEVALQRFNWRDGWNGRWISTPEGNAYLQTLHHYRVKLNHDGTFQVSGVPGGEYELAIKIYERTGHRAVNIVATKLVRFDVTEGGGREGPVDLGKIEIDGASGQEPGNEVSEFEIDVLDAGDT